MDDECNGRMNRRSTKLEVQKIEQKFKQECSAPCLANWQFTGFSKLS